MRSAFSTTRFIVCIFFAFCMIPLIVGCSTSATPPTVMPKKVDVTHPYDVKANAQQDIETALVAAKTDHKYVLVDMGGNWCPDCLVLAKLYEVEPLKSFVEKNYHLVTVDIGQFDKNLDISNRYGNPIQNGVPAVVVLDANGKLIGSTGDGALESARNMNGQQVINVLQKWVPSGN